MNTKTAFEVVYTKNGTDYRAVIPVKWRETAEREIIMTRQVGRSQIKLIQPVRIRGYTLIEVVASIAILAMLAVLGFMVYAGIHFIMKYW